MIDDVVLDVEVLEDPTVVGWENTDRLGLSVAMLYDCAAERVVPYYAGDLADLLERLTRADRVVGFNVLDFDLPVLHRVARGEWLGSEQRKLWRDKVVDLLQDIWLGLSTRFQKGWNLDHVCKSTIGRGKTGDGAQAARLWAAGERGAVEAYCRNDVEITRDLYFHVVANGYVNGGVPPRALPLRYTR